MGHHQLEILAGLFSYAVLQTAQAEAPRAFRVTDFDLRDPHMYIDYLGCRDVTDTPLFGFSVNDEYADNIGADGDGDGYLDLSLLLVFRSTPELPDCGNFIFADALCTAPPENTECRSSHSGGSLFTTYVNSYTGICLSPHAGTTKPYVPAVTNSSAPCFSASLPFAALSFGGGVPFTLTDLQIAATTVGNPSTQLVNGLLRGFLSEAVANNTIIPSSFPITGGQPLSIMLPGGDPPGPSRNCAFYSDKDLGLDGHTPGWWFYFNFTAEPVPLACVIPPDYTLDCHVDLADWAKLQECWIDSAADKCFCSHAHWNGDPNLLLDEYSAFQNCFSGSESELSPSCWSKP